MSSSRIPVNNPFGLGEEKNPIVLGVIWAFTGACVLIVALRFFVRVKVNRMLTSDDWFMGLATLGQVAYGVFITLSCVEALKPLGPPPIPGAPPFNTNVVKFSLFSMIPATSASILGRISATILLIRIFGSKTWFKWYLIVLTTIQTIAGFLAIVFGFARTLPMEALWQPWLIQHERWHIHVHTYTAATAAAFFGLSDLTYVLFPTIIIWNLNMNLRRRIGLCLLMGTSIFTMAAAIIKAVATLAIYSSVFKPYESLIWAAIEQAFVIIMGCVPALMPITRLDHPVIRWVNSLISSRESKHRTPTDIPQHGHSLSFRKNNAGYQDMEMRGVGNGAIGGKRSGSGRMDETSLTIDEVRYNVKGGSSGSSSSNKQSDLETGSASTEFEDPQQHQLAKTMTYSQDNLHHPKENV